MHWVWVLRDVKKYLTLLAPAAVPVAGDLTMARDSGQELEGREKYWA